MPEFQTALLIKPDVAGFSALAQLYAIRGELDEAALYFRESIKLSPDYALGHALLSKVFVRMGNTEQADIHFQEAMRLDPNCELNFCQ